MEPHLGASILRTVDDVEKAVARFVWPKQMRPDRLGIEVEAFPMRVDSMGPAGRLPLHGTDSVVATVEAVATERDVIFPRQSGEYFYRTSAGGRITFEPGGQIEHSSAPCRTTRDVANEMSAVWGRLRDAFWSDGVCLLSLGVDPWTDLDSIPQQLDRGRYIAMDEYLANRGPAGRVMMRNTTSIQVSLDAGNDTRTDRWLAANLLSPILTAMFASSPGNGAASLRALAWQGLDPTRTGFPQWSSASAADPLADVVSRALDADVMYIDRGDRTITGAAGFTFRTWLRDAHKSAGPPTLDDLESHLTTLFTEVRPRNNVLELRGIDGLPQRWWQVPMLIAAPLIYDSTARALVIDALSSLAPRLDLAWQTAARQGLHDRELATMATALGELAVAAAAQHPERYDPAEVAITSAYLESFTFRGLAPADVLAQKLDHPMDALAWAAPEHATKGSA